MKALIAEDDSVTRVSLERLLGRWGFETIAVKDGEAALAEMEKPEPPRLVLLDWVMPRVDGLEVCRRLRAKDTSDPPYIIFLTAKEAAGDIACALDSGASDCIRKPFDREELLARIRAGERTLRLQAELNAARREMSHLAMYDPLTEIYNRRAVTERLIQEMARAARSREQLCVGIADLDGFKQINDNRGHRAGDHVLKTFVKTVQETIRTSDVVGRWGGEEFLILAPNDPEVGTNTLFERIRRRTRELSITDGADEIRFTVSIGVAVARRGESSDSVIHRADVALYEAKRNGKDQVRFASLVEGEGPGEITSPSA